MNKLNIPAIALAVVAGIGSMLLGSSVKAAESKESLREGFCLGAGEIASNTASMRSMGLSQEEAIGMVQAMLPKKTKTDVLLAKYNKQVMTFVYTMGLSKEDSAKIVYLRCMAGSFGGSEF